MEKRSIRMTGRMMTVADSVLFPRDIPLREPRADSGNLMSVPIVQSPNITADRPQPISDRRAYDLETSKVNGPLTRHA